MSPLAPRGRPLARIVATVLAVVMLLGVQACAPARDDRSEILWDTWGVPHIFAGTTTGAFRAFGYAQMQSHGNLLLGLYAQARGQAAALGGDEYLQSDVIVRTMGLRERGAAWYDAQSPDFRADVDAFVDGINEYGRTRRDQLDRTVASVLPVTGPDVFAHAARLTLNFLASTSSCGQLEGGSSAGAGSNGWAIGPARSASGNAMLLANPHLGWGGENMLYEAQLVDGANDVYGAAPIGLPVVTMGFTDRIAWTLTVNPIDACDLYELTANESGYRIDGAGVLFETSTARIEIRKPDGTLLSELVDIRRSGVGPVFEKDGKFYAVRSAAVGQTDTPGLLEQWYRMSHAKDLDEFRGVLDSNQLPMFNVLYADRDGHVFAAFAGQVPRRAATDVANGAIKHVDSSAGLWTTVHPFSELPQTVDPPGGFVQNSNSAPWTYTLPRVADLDPARFPSSDFPGEYVNWRERRALTLIRSEPTLSFDDLLRLKNDTRMELADSLVPDLTAAAAQSPDPDVRAAATVLRRWDRRADADSRGTVLFLAWVREVQSVDPSLDSFFRVPYDPADPAASPEGLARRPEALDALKRAAVNLNAATGRLDVPWGDVARLRRGGVDLPASGFQGDPFGVFRVLTPDLNESVTGRPSAVSFGDSFVAVVEFAQPLRAEVLVAYGNSSRPDSPHYGDQLALTAKGELRPAWRTRDVIEQHLEERTVIR
ncbi:penicillin acylase family protein [Pseudonocardia charpentierae]|uniref:Penicillin acylase family protein n=1 Tax=Pseudonocardia charpentierae TaxID=3075545 RepID=A0ABU2NLK9_9PSEU|nr:penicillin acylase family protein [Pseudonocardia sp. DSM 45834]MDT0353499.1 penicillin acylase family protein [Pseudonocardia sp. DSM 45834]